VLVDFHAVWCDPCRILGPILDEVARESKTPLTLVKIDIDQHADIAQAAGVSGIPDVRLFVNGQQVGGFTGAHSKPAVERFLADQLTAPTR
jgi:putative thioredoxin